MENLIIEQTEFTPFISFDEGKCELKISGVSRPEDVGNFYAEALEWLRRFENLNLKDPIGKDVHVEFFFSYFNSASAKIILQMLEIIKRMSESGLVVRVDWNYEAGDEQVKEDGEELSYALDLPFNYLPR